MWSVNYEWDSPIADSRDGYFFSVFFFCVYVCACLNVLLSHCVFIRAR